MNLQKYIESGILELYMAGGLNKKEMSTVKELMAQYPEIEREVAEIEFILIQYFQNISLLRFTPTLKAGLYGIIVKKTN